MKSFPEHNAAWVEHLPYWQPGLFPGSRSHKREDVEGGWPRTVFANDVEGQAEVIFNHVMSAHTAAFADIIGEYTLTLYGQPRTIAILKILSFAWRRSRESGFGTRVWMRSVCQEAMS